MPIPLLRSGRILVASAMLTLLFPPLVLAQYKVLHAFGNGRDGGGLWTSVTLDKQGRLYGATSGGGAFGQGIVFRLTPGKNGSWSESILHSFPSFPNDGQGPNGGLVQDSLGNWYGTTGGGGTDHTAGTVFTLTQVMSHWRETILYSFGTQKGDGGEPTAGLVMDKGGNLFGTNRTTVFELSPSLESNTWQETVLHRFLAKSDGEGVYAGVILDHQGNLYGTTSGGGIGCAGGGCGVVYEIERTANGWKEKILHYFINNGKDGNTPGNNSLFLDKGCLYGTTVVGGKFGWGVLFKLRQQDNGSWQETILYDFGNAGNGVFPTAGVVMDTAGTLYGTTENGGSGCDCGVVYKLAPTGNGKWTYTVLHTFQGYDGAQPMANLILDNNGNLYGTTATGGQYGSGVVFELTP